MLPGYLDAGTPARADDADMTGDSLAELDSARHRPLVGPAGRKAELPAHEADQARIAPEGFAGPAGRRPAQ